VGDSDIHLGEIGGCPFYMSRAQFAYWEHTQLTIDVVPGPRRDVLAGRPRGAPLPHPVEIYTEEESLELSRDGSLIQGGSQK